MKTLFTYLPMLFLLSLFNMACSDSKDDPAFSTDPPMGTDPKINLISEANPVISSDGGTQEVSFNVNTNWTVKSDQLWCIASPANGKAGTAKVNLTVDPNDSYDNREATITIKAGKATQTVKLTQMQKDAIIVAMQNYIVPAEANTLVFDINTNISDFDVKVTDDCNWIHYQAKTRSLQTIQLQFNIDALTDSQERTAQIFVSKGVLKQTVTVTQAFTMPVSTVSIVHTAYQFTAPILKGEQFNKGKIQWGDQQEETYTDAANHQYQDGQKQHVVIIEGQGIDEINFNELTNVLSIDFSNM